MDTYLKSAKENGFDSIKQYDQTDNTMLTLDYANYFIERFINPTIDNGLYSTNKNNPKIHDKNSKDNILIVGKVKTGNIDIEENKAFEIEGELETSYVEHAYIEPEAGSSWIEGNTLVIQTCTQAPYMDRDDTAKILGLDKNKVRIIPSSSGGGFGSKLDVSLQPLLGLVTLKTKKPCRSVSYTHLRAHETLR